MTTSKSISPSSGLEEKLDHRDSQQQQQQQQQQQHPPLKKHKASSHKDKTETENDTSDVPQYGSQEYWELRYKTHREQTRKSIPNNNNNNDDDDDDDNDDDDKNEEMKKQSHVDADNTDDEALPYHAWYFTYADLRPLLLPLLLGETLTDDMGDLKSCPADTHHEDASVHETQKSNDLDSKNGAGEDDDEEDAEEEEEADEVEDEVRSAVDDPDENDSNDGDDDVDNDQDDEFEVVEVDESGDEEGDDDGPPERKGITKDGPVSILEIGCGDVPLGKDLIVDLIHLDCASNNLSGFIDKVVCCDYSPTVIAVMEEKKLQIEGAIELTADNLSTLDKKLNFEALDARKMSYADKCFGLILEKGTLDALLSDKDVGVANCQSVMTESARVLAVGGSMVIISHLNAHTDSGIRWLDEVVLVGLRAGGGGASWEIEVHGNDGVSHQMDNDQGDAAEPHVPGPCVYIIHKLHTSEPKSSTTDNDAPTIPVRFFSY